MKRVEEEFSGGQVQTVAKRRVLLVDDDENAREALSEWLQRHGIDVLAVPDGQSALQHLYEGVSVIVTDLKMPHTNGLELLKTVKDLSPETAVILVTGHATVNSAVEALREGAFDYLTKPVNPHELAHRIGQAIEKESMVAEIAKLNTQVVAQPMFAGFVGQSEAMERVFERIQLVADTRSTVLIIGESGTGKELVASALHHRSHRKSRPFVPVNCAAIPESLIESELFGHEKGAFTGADSKRAGLFQAAHGGTLFIDEIGELQLGLQSKLLRAIETRKVMPVGSHQELEVDVRLVTATNRDLEEQVRDKQFRDDLYYRLKVVEIRLPPLRDRREDIPLLVDFFMKQLAAENHRPVKALSDEVMAALTGFDWPGNVRELRNTLEGIVVLSRGETIELEDLPEYIGGASPPRRGLSTGGTLAEIEKNAIQQALDRTNGHRAEAAKILAISVRTIQRKIKEYDLQV